MSRYSGRLKAGTFREKLCKCSCVAQPKPVELQAIWAPTPFDLVAPQHFGPQRCICGQALRAVGIRRLPHLFVGGPRVFPRHVGIHDQDQPHAHVAVPVHAILVQFHAGPYGSHSSCTVVKGGV